MYLKQKKTHTTLIKIILFVVIFVVSGMLNSSPKTLANNANVLNETASKKEIVLSSAVHTNNLNAAVGNCLVKSGVPPVSTDRIAIDLQGSTYNLNTIFSVTSNVFEYNQMVNRECNNLQSLSITKSNYVNYSVSLIQPAASLAPFYVVFSNNSKFITAHLVQSSTEIPPILSQSITYQYLAFEKGVDKNKYVTGHRVGNRSVHKYILNNRESQFQILNC